MLGEGLGSGWLRENSLGWVGLGWLDGDYRDGWMDVWWFGGVGERRGVRGKRRRNVVWNVECGRESWGWWILEVGGCRYVIGGFGSLEFLYWIGFWEDGERERGLLAVKIPGGL